MKILITGLCGFVGSTLARGLRAHQPGLEIIGLDNLTRAGSERNRFPLAQDGFAVHHGDIRLASDLEDLPAVDWVIDAAANASVLAGLNAAGASRQLAEHNLWGTVNLLEYCKRHRAGFLMLSTSRVYSLRALAGLEMETCRQAFQPRTGVALPHGCSRLGLTEDFSVTPPLSLYGSTKLASETMALEYGDAFQFPVWINRCGVLAGAGQFGRPDQGIFTYWIHAYRHQHPLKYTGFDGSGFQVRDCLHPADLVPLLHQQMERPSAPCHKVQNVAGGTAQCMSLAQLSAWCAARFGPREIQRAPAPRPFDVPWLVLDAARAQHQWDWRPRTPLESILEELARHAEQHPDWLARSGVL